MKISEGTAALVALEDARPDVLFESIPGSDYPIWPLFRWATARATQEIELGTFSARTPLSRIQLARRLARRLAPNPFASSRIRSPADILFVVNGGTFSQTPTGRRNWLVEDFAESLDRPAVILQDRDLDLFTPAAERPTFVPTVTFADAFGRGEVAIRRHPLPAHQVERIHGIVAETVRTLPFSIDPDRVARIQAIATTRVARARALEGEYRRLIDRVRPRVVVMEEVSYGDRILAPMLRRDGIVVAEPQHGWIGPYHSAYNFGAAMSDPVLNIALPDALLTFGEFWSEGVRFPNELVTIGKPQLESMAAQALPKTDTVLVVSSVTAREHLTEVTRAVRELLPSNWGVRFRPHPQERGREAELYPGLAGRAGIEFDLAPDVLESLAQARGVFGLASTVLYEALAFDCAVFVIDSPLAEFSSSEEIFGPRVSRDSLPEAIAHIRAGNTSTGTLDRVWAPRARDRFAAYVARVLTAP